MHMSFAATRPRGIASSAMKQEGGTFVSKRTPTPLTAAPSARPDPEQIRLPMPVALGLIAFPVLGTVLAVMGMPTSEIVPLLTYCAGIGVAAVLAVSGGRRLVAGLASFVVRITR